MPSLWPNVTTSWKCWRKVETMTDSLDLLAALVLEDGQRWGEIAADFQWDDAAAFFDDDGPLWTFTHAPRGGLEDDRPGWHIAGLAGDRSKARCPWVCLRRIKDQAALLLDAASGLVDRTPELNEVIEVQATKLVALRSGATVEIRSADAAHAYGLRPSFCVADEVAQWEETRRAKRLWTAIVSSLAKVPGCRFVCLTSAGEPVTGAMPSSKEAIASSRPLAGERGPRPAAMGQRCDDLQAQGLRDSEYARFT